MRTGEWSGHHQVYLVTTALQALRKQMGSRKLNHEPLQNTLYAMQSHLPVYIHMHSHRVSSAHNTIYQSSDLTKQGQKYRLKKYIRADN